jgi:nucleoid-associated protein YgaU
MARSILDVQRSAKIGGRTTTTTTGGFRGPGGLNRLSPGARMGLIFVIPLVMLLVLTLPMLFGGGDGETGQTGDVPGNSIEDEMMESILSAESDLEPRDPMTPAGGGLAIPTRVPGDDEIVGTRPTAEPAATAPGQPAATGTKYTIKPNDTLSGIAARFLGHAKYWKKIVDANPGLDPNRLQLGTEIIIPGASGPGETLEPQGSPRPRGIPEFAPSGPKPAVDPVGLTDFTDEPAGPTTPRMVAKTVTKLMRAEVIHILRDGETQFSLATKYFGGDITRYAEIESTNPQIDWASATPGARVTIPKWEAQVEELVPVAPRAAAAADAGTGGLFDGLAGSGRPQQPTATAGGKTHVIQPGETLSSISRKYYGTAAHWPKLQAANGIADASRLRVGTTITIPVIN